MTPLKAHSHHKELKSCKPALLAQINEQKRINPQGCPISQKLVFWLGILRNADQFTPNELIHFLNNHSHWPHYDKLCLKAEDIIATKGTPKEILTWFEAHPPQTPEGTIAYANVLLAHKEKSKTIKVVSHAWHTLEFTKAEEKKILARFGQFLQEKDHIARLEFLLWNEDVEEAKRLLNRVSINIRKIAEVRIAFLGGNSDAIQKMKALPDKLRSEESLLYAQTKWYRKREEVEKAANILTQVSSEPRYAVMWWKERNYIARELLVLNDYQKAYDVLNNHGLKPGAENYADAEWFRGWLALRFLDQPQQAQQHFEDLFSHAQGAITKARGAYWVGRAFEAQDELTLAEKWYRKAARYRTTYYGQLAAGKIKEKSYPSLALASRATVEEKRRFEQNEIVQAAYILKGLGTSANHELSKFLLHISDQSKTKSERELSVLLAHTLSPYEVVWAAKKAGYREPVLLKKAFPVYAIPRKGQDIPEEAFVMAIVYQESRFNPTVQSPAGAMGLMQLISKTAAHEAKRLGVKHSDKQLYNPQHNLHLGTAHLARLLNTFDNSYILASAAYNAGPSPVHRWIKELGDPRSDNIDPIDWIEKIPYAETRNYVMRVMENITNYRCLNGLPKKTLVNDLRN
ncbi:MAG: lytic transglycosylase domain-containing protein [Alphaproteobacteria bacterium]|nr:lytic transglycosylase domain-containing protein [Alphaproteobacteria bacterium]